MLSKKNRIPRHLFPIILTGRKYSFLNIYMRVARLNKEGRKESRFSFVVSKKEVKKAVERNRLRRIGYNIIQKNISNINKGYTVAFFLKKGTVALSKKELEEEIISLLKKANLLKIKKFYA